MAPLQVSDGDTLEKLPLQIAIKSSQLIDMFTQGYLSACSCLVSFDKQNTLDLMSAGEIDEASTLKMQVLSTDKRSISTKTKEKLVIECLNKTTR